MKHPVVLLKQPVALLAAALLATGMGLTTAAPASAADCPSGNFCAWTDADFGGQRVSWSGDDDWWDTSIADEDSSWANHRVPGPGVKDHVRVYESAIQFPSTGGDMTICLRPGDEVRYNATANDRGDAHVGFMGCG
ncbi:peptidase inhibitor family I36 protein [Streptomyces sp. NRRL B-1347]|uniref:peptidase inhibitor family I36 protein n=1 Tax=Streptomyces sp. NRRL B-1347 TaxID=1476877 RepID=UPI0004C5F6CE|nr:peptidase inhibitor family I36 protein [Streptomyces sp. NRRL B-1347]